jgi:gas vesicle protein
MSKNSGKWAAGALAAGAVGYLIGILTAPKSGKETREDIRNAAMKAKSEAEKRLKALLSELNQKIEAAKVQGAKLKGKAKVEFDKATQKAVNAKQKVREVLSALHDGDADDPELKQAIKDAKAAIKNLETYVKK